ncbi:MAG: hypothetical protein Q9182_007199 [Xanthomendoza sp. 2 TL-2023]
MHAPPTLHLSYLKDPSMVLSDVEGMPDDNAGSRGLPNLDEDISIVFRAVNVKTIWSSVASPCVETTMFAVGTSQGAMLIGLKGGTDQTWMTRATGADDDEAADALAVDFWKSNLVLAGMRSGKVRLWDLRSDSATVRFQHPSSVRNIKALDDNKVLVAGLRNKMAIYDIRFTNKLQQTLQSGIIEASIPFQDFPTYRLGSHLYPKLGFDVHLGMGLIASATEDEKLQIFDWKNSYQDMDLGNRQEPLFHTLTGHIRCVKFVEDQKRGDGLKLLIAHGAKIDAWAW